MSNIELNFPNIDEIPGDLVEAVNGNKIIASILYNRGITDLDKAKEFLDTAAYKPTSVEEFPDIKKAVERLNFAIKNNENILVYGDYDCDGITSTTLLVDCFKRFTGNVTYHVPDRFKEGYGMNSEVIKKQKGKGINLIVTCDCGISNIEEISLAKELGIDVIITDHHTIPDELPPADVILNPKLLSENHPAYNLSGCGMAYYLAKALLEEWGRGEVIEEYLDLVSLSIIADVVPLHGENRYLFKKGINKLLYPTRPGLKELYKIIERKTKVETEEEIAFQVAPRLNAAGRLDSAVKPVELLLSKDTNKASKLVTEINFLNTQRKVIQENIINEAVELVEKEKKDKKILVLYKSDWHQGVLGIAAGKICELYKRPVIMLSLKEDKETITGSARSTENVNIYELIKKCSNFLTNFGGHSQAAGLSLNKDKLNDFIKEMEWIAEDSITEDEKEIINIDINLELEEVTEALYKNIRKLAPYGEGFSKPLFYSENVEIFSDRVINDKHHQMVLGNENNRIVAVKWNDENKDLSGRKVNVVYSIGRDNYHANNNIKLTLEHLIAVGAEEASGVAGSIIDARNYSLRQLVDRYKNGTFFYEGIKRIEDINTVDRSEVTSCEELILLSVPASSEILREIVSLANPEKLVFSFNQYEPKSLNEIINDALRIIKTVINKYKGYIDLIKIASLLNQEETTILCILEFLKAKGLIKYEMSEDYLIFIEKGDNKQKTALTYATKNLKDKISETKAFQSYLLAMELGTIKNLISAI